jgi:hypothetical protein
MLKLLNQKKSLPYKPEIPENTSENVTVDKKNQVESTKNRKSPYASLTKNEIESLTSYDFSKLAPMEEIERIAEDSAQFKRLRKKIGKRLQEVVHSRKATGLAAKLIDRRTRFGPFSRKAFVKMRAIFILLLILATLFGILYHYYSDGINCYYYCFSIFVH